MKAEQEKELLITGGNTNYYSQLFPFLYSLREKGEFKGKIVVCDNTTSVNWRHRIGWSKKPSFSAPQRAAIQGLGVDIIDVNPLMIENEVDFRRIGRIYTEHCAYPLKFVYCSLIALRYGISGCPVGFIDADMLVQRPFSLGEYNSPNLHVGSEGVLIGETRLMSKWMSQIQPPAGRIQVGYKAEIAKRPNLCSGFFAAESGAFRSFTEQLWHLGEVAAFKFHSDQPLLNYAVWRFGIPINDVSCLDVAHMAYVNKSRVSFNQELGEIAIDGRVPKVIHHHGWIRHDRELSLILDRFNR
jgi:hypothetical protein